ncbi:hypothetical protein CCHR01_02627 [Colletotrichum chrysophilum]|uniref:Uncharacterized protein n=1 Tax=Colletotrichum chrysophilum TaxID=1836956 RepID=A0AAD9ES64_9PEZI|nr:hypothetical protein CCHR01_02627 [Colletotrichum chrysophilum]
MPASPLGATAASQRSAAKSDWRLGFRSGGGHDQPEPSSSISTYSETWSFTHTHKSSVGQSVVTISAPGQDCGSPSWKQWDRGYDGSLARQTQTQKQAQAQEAIGKWQSN